MNISNLRGLPLTDARIEHYMLLGKYGESARLNAEKRKLLASIRKSSTRSKPKHDKKTKLVDESVFDI